MRFEFATASRIVFGPGTLKELSEAAARLGRRSVLVTNEIGGGRSLLESLARQEKPVEEWLLAQGIQGITFLVPGEPTIDLVRQGVKLARQADADLVIGIGGGSAMDTGKAIAALLANGGDPLDYLEVIGLGKPLVKPSIPCIAVPTTAGTGAEVTRNAVLASPEQQVKASLRSPGMLPVLALVDPELTCGLPPEVTASTGLDALTQVLEPYVSNRSNPVTDAFAREGMHRAAQSLLRAYQNGEDREAREDMSLASLFGGLALANAGLGAVHGFASVLGGMYPAPHGAICARLLPPVMEINVRALKQRQANSLALLRYRQVAEILTGRPGATPEDGLAWVKDLAEALHIPRLGSLGLTQADFPTVVEKTQAASSTKANPIRLANAELEEILTMAI